MNADIDRLREAANRGKPDGMMMLATSEIAAAATEIERLRAILVDLSKLRRYNTNRSGRPAKTLTVNTPATLLARIDDEVKR